MAEDDNAELRSSLQLLNTGVANLLKQIEQGDRDATYYAAACKGVADDVSVRLEMLADSLLQQDYEKARMQLEGAS